MKLVAAEKVRKWVETQWKGHFEWDDGNIHKLAKHKVSQEEVEEIFLAESIFQGQILASQSESWESEERFLQFGETPDGKLFSIVWTRRNGNIRPISCRRMRDAEQKTYREKKSGRD
jgi:uncharacterized DUF497 family protein